MSRRAAGEGMVRERKPGHWEARYVAADGRKRSLYGPTKRSVTDRLRKALTDAEQGIRPVTKQLTTGDFLDCGSSASATSRQRTHASYADTVTRYIKPSIGKVPLAKLQPEHVQAMLADVRRDHPTLSATTIRYVYTACCASRWGGP